MILYCAYLTHVLIPKVQMCLFDYYVNKLVSVFLYVKIENVSFASKFLSPKMYRI